MMQILVTILIVCKNKSKLPMVRSLQIGCLLGRSPWIGLTIEWHSYRLGSQLLEMKCQKRCNIFEINVSSIIIYRCIKEMMTMYLIEIEQWE